MNFIPFAFAECKSAVFAEGGKFEGYRSIVIRFIGQRTNEDRVQVPCGAGK